MTQFTANEVVTKLRERFTSGNDVPVPDVRLTRAEFDAFADLLEAREKAVPVAYALFTEKGLIRMWSREWFADAHGAPVNPTPLYVHPTPADTERLAEALRNLVSEWVAIADDGDATLEDSTIGYRACANRLSAMLATHSTQAQPPAASVTDAMVERAQDCLHDKGKDIGHYHMRAALEAALAAQENPNGL